MLDDGVILRTHVLRSTWHFVLPDDIQQDGLICTGPGSSYALLVARAPSARRLDRDEALAEIALRHVTGHGPATERDLAYWATLTVSSAAT